MKCEKTNPNWSGLGWKLINYGMRLSAAVIVVLFVGPLSLWGQSEAGPSNSDIRRGSFQSQFTEPDPRSALDAQTQRHRIGIGNMERYALKDATFEVRVPQEYDPAVAHGLFVWVNAGNRGGMPRAWGELFDKHKLIFISANDSGNDRAVVVRFGLALDGVHNLCKLYNIDPSRIYVGGISGGGKVASMLAVIYPDVFSGAVPVVGVSYFKHIPVGDDPMKVWAAEYTRPPTATLERARELGRFVFITGPNDMNRDSIKGTYDKGFSVDGFKFADYFEVPGMGHTLPPPEWIDRAIEKMDQPLSSLAGRMLDMGQQFDRARKPADARMMYRSVLLHGDPRLAERAKELLAALDRTAVAITPKPSANPITPATRPASDTSPEAEAQRLLSLAENYLRNRLYSMAKERAEKIVRDYPNTKSATRAREIIRQAGSEQR